MAEPGHSIHGAVNRYLQDVAPSFRAVADGELRAQAWVAPAGVLDPHMLLHRNRLQTGVRYAHSLAGDVHVHAELPEIAVTPAELDRMLGSLVDAAAVVRAVA
jgi:hypothetical protein